MDSLLAVSENPLAESAAPRDARAASVVRLLCSPALATLPFSSAPWVRARPPCAACSLFSASMRLSVALPKARSALPAASAAPSKAATSSVLAVAISFSDRSDACASAWTASVSSFAAAVNRLNVPAPASLVTT